MVGEVRETNSIQCGLVCIDCHSKWGIDGFAKGFAFIMPNSVLLLLNSNANYKKVSVVGVGTLGVERGVVGAVFVALFFLSEPAVFFIHPSIFFYCLLQFFDSFSHFFFGFSLI